MPYTSNVESGGRSEQTKIIAGTAAAADVRSGTNFVPNTAANQVVAGSMPNCQITEVTPKTADQVISKGSYIASDIKVKGDSNLLSGNIKSGASIFGVTGNRNVVDTADATISASDVRENKSGYKGGSLIHGSIPDNTVTEIQPGTSEKTIGVGQYIAKAIKILGDVKLIAENIKSGVSIFGVKGTFTSDATVSPSDILSGKTAYKNGGRISGTMADRGAYGYASGFGEGADYYAFNNIPSGYYHETSGTAAWSPEVRLSKNAVRNALGVAARKIVKGESIAGIAGTAQIRTIQSISQVATHDVNGCDHEPGDVQFTMQQNGWVVYSGFTLHKGIIGSWCCICEIYKNGVLIDHRNIDQNNRYTWRGTMQNKFFAANAGDVILVRCKTSGQSSISFSMLDAGEIRVS